MDAATLLRDWLATSTLRLSSQAEYQREVGSFLTWCHEQNPPIDALAARPKDVAAWAYERYLRPFLPGIPFTGPDALAHLADTHPDAARTHDRRITALTMYYKAAVDRGIITLPPDLRALRSGVNRPAGARNRLDDLERAALLTAIGAWGPHRSKRWQRDRLAVYLLLEGMRPSQVIRLDRRHIYPQPDGTTQVRAPDDHESVGRQFVLNRMTSAALTAYLAVRPEPADPAEQALLLNSRREQLQFRWVNKLVGEMVATESLLAEREPAVTADMIAHTGFLDAPPSPLRPTIRAS
jgi:integrase